MLLIRVGAASFFNFFSTSLKSSISSLSPLRVFGRPLKNGVYHVELSSWQTLILSAFVLLLIDSGMIKDK